MSDALRRKTFNPTIEDIGQRMVRFVISTGTVDRDGDTINPKGWDLTAYKANPVVLWAHDYKTLPVGRAVTVEIVDGKLISDCEFADHEFAETVYKMSRVNSSGRHRSAFRPRNTSRTRHEVASISSSKP